MYGSNSVTLALDDLHDLRDIFLAGIMVRCFHHHTNDRLSAGLTNQNADVDKKLDNYRKESIEFLKKSLESFW